MKKLALLGLALSLTSLFACNVEISEKQCKNKEDIWKNTPSVFLDKNITVSDTTICCEKKAKK